MRRALLLAMLSLSCGNELDCSKPAEGCPCEKTGAVTCVGMARLSCQGRAEYARWFLDTSVRCPIE